MNEDGKSYAPPLMLLEIRGDRGSALNWSLEIRANDAKGERPLGYKAQGTDLAISAEESLFPIKVHDEVRDVWTEMPADHRKDVRAAMRKLLGDALASLSSVHR